MPIFTYSDKDSVERMQFKHLSHVFLAVNLIFTLVSIFVPFAAHIKLGIILGTLAASLLSNQLAKPTQNGTRTMQYLAGTVLAMGISAALMTNFIFPISLPFTMLTAAAAYGIGNRFLDKPQSHATELTGAEKVSNGISTALFLALGIAFLANAFTPIPGLISIPLFAGLAAAAVITGLGSMIFISATRSNHSELGAGPATGGLGVSGAHMPHLPGTKHYHPVPTGEHGAPKPTPQAAV